MKEFWRLSKQIDLDGDNKLNKKEFENLINLLKTRPEINELFYS